MGTLRIFAESFGIFAVSIVVLYLINIIAIANTGKAFGSGWFQWKGYVLMGVGVLYFVFGLIVTRVLR